MKQTSVLRVTAEICFFFSILNVFDAFHAWRLPMALFTAACLLLGLVIVRLKNPPARLFLSVLPALCFLTGPFSLLLIFPLTAWIYFFLVIYRGNYAMPLEDYRKSYAFMLVISLFFVAANIANSTIYTDHLISVDNLIYIFFFLILGVLAMRRMQMGTEMSLNWQMRNLLSVIGAPVVAVSASLILFLLLRFSGKALSMILTPVGRFFVWLFHRLFPSGNLPIEEMTLTEYITHKTAPVVPDLEGFGVKNEIEVLTGEPSDTMLIERAAAVGSWVLLGILLILVLLFIRRRIKRNESAKKEEPLYEETETVPADGRQRRRKRIPLLAGNARQLRRIYITYLEYRKSRGISVHPSDTSADILERDREMSESEDAKKLRDLYIAARYGNPSAVTRSQVLEAQACLERIVG